MLIAGMLLKRAARGQLGLVQAATGVPQVIMDTFAMESALLRTQKLAESGKGVNAADMTAVLVRDAMAHVDVIACWRPAPMATRCANLVVLRCFGKYEPEDSIALRRKIAHRLLDAERYNRVMDDPTPWPPLPLAQWESTRATLHMWTQIVGKVRLALSPRVNHWWQVPLYVSARGLTTSAIPYGDGAFEVEFDFASGNLEIRKSGRAETLVRLYPRSVADFYGELMAALRALGIDVKIWRVPVEIANPIPFPDDCEHASYDPEYVNRFHRILLQADTILKEFRSRFIGKASPVHFFWGSFDLAATRFSGRRAPERVGADPITREAYSHECSSAGFWPGGGDITGPAFYSYAAPEPPGYAACSVLPPAASYHTGLREFILMYDDVRRAASPRTALLDFLQSTYDAAANLGNWDRVNLERSPIGGPE